MFLKRFHGASVRRIERNGAMPSGGNEPQRLRVGHFGQDQEPRRIARHLKGVTALSVASRGESAPPAR